MKLAIWGAPGSGTTELFAAITGRDPAAGRGNKLASVKVPDPRVDKLAEIWKSKKRVYVEAQFADLSADGANKPAEALQTLGAYEALIHVVNGSSLAESSPEAQISDLAAELLIRDQMVIEKRLERMKKANEKGVERDLLEQALAHLETDKPLRLLDLQAAQWAQLSGFSFLSRRALLVVVNVDEDQAAAEPSAELRATCEALGANCLSLSAAIEAEIAQLDAEDQRAFLDDLGLGEPARGRFLQAAYRLLDLQTFLTMGEDESRAWTVRKGAKAPETGGRIHSDIERGFIRVEVIRYDNFIELGSEAACRKAGKMRVEGKDYLVQEGDILNFRFNV